jgi:glucosylceramidase
MIGVRVALKIVAPAFALLLAACTAAPSGTTAPSDTPPSTGNQAELVEYWSSSADGSRRLARLPDLQLIATGSNGQTVMIDPAQRFQSMVGFGAAMTDASASLMMGLPAGATRDALFDELFLPDRLALSFMRLPIGASDFSAIHYSFDDMPRGAIDPGLAQFSMAPAAAQIAATKAAMVRNPGLSLMASPWSAPGWMKSSDSLIKGSLLPERYADFAAYLDRYVTEMSREGLAINYLSIQNEPHFEPADYPGMRVDPAQRAAFVGQHLGPLLELHHQTVQILDWDHNWNEPDAPRPVLADPIASRYVSGVAWHCYGGDVSAQGIIHDAFPAKDSFFTECSGGGWAPDWGETLGWMTRNLIIGTTRNWSRGALLWNLALDENAGPHKGGCGNCRGVVTIDSRTGAVTRNVEYYVLGHASRFVRKDAQRIYSNEAGGIINVAWVNPDGSIVLLAHNPTALAARLSVFEQGRGFNILMPPGEVSSFVWHRPVP